MAAGNERHDHMLDTGAHPENRKAAGFLFHPATARNSLLAETREGLLRQGRVKAALAPLDHGR